MPDATRRVPVALGLLLALVLGACFALPPVYRKHKTKRAHKAIAEVGGAMSAGDVQRAGLRIRLALSLAPDDPDVQRATAKFCDELGSSDAVQYWQILLDSGKATRADRIGYARSLIKLDRPEPARQLLIELLRENLHDFECIELSLQALLLEKRTRDALVAARTLAEQFPNDDKGLLQLSQTLLAQNETNLKFEGQTILWGLALRDNPYLLPAIQTLTRQTDLTRPEIQLLARRVPANHTNQVAVGLLKLDLALLLDPNKPHTEIALAATKSIPSNAPIGAALEVSGWLYEHRLYEEGLQLIPESAARTNLAALQLHLQGLGNLNQWTQASKLVEDPSMPLPSVLRDVYRALVASRLGTPQEVAAHLANAAAGTRSDPGRAGIVASYAESFDLPAIAAEALQNLMADPARIARTGRKVLRLLERVDDTRPLLQALDRVILASPHDSRLRNERAWWLLITGQRIEECRATAEELHRESPDELRYTATLSLAHLREGNTDLALQTIESPFLASTNPPTRARFAYAAALGNGGQREAARRIAKPLIDARLRSAERILITNWFDSIPNP